MHLDCGAVQVWPRCARFITLEDETGLVNLIIRPDLRERARETLHAAPLLLAEGRLQREAAAVSLLVQGVTALRP